MRCEPPIWALSRVLMMTKWSKGLQSENQYCSKSFETCREITWEIYDKSHITNATASWGMTFNKIKT
jgi:hypothetical protein